MQKFEEKRLENMHINEFTDEHYAMQFE